MIISAKNLNGKSIGVGDSNYCVIMGIAKRAREIVDEERANLDNPVEEAVKEFKAGKFIIDLPDSLI